MLSMVRDDMLGFFRNDLGVTVVFGTLMMILITVVAATTVAFYVSQAQEQAIERESHIAAVENEKLEIISIDPIGNESRLDSLDLTILNLNTEDSKISAISVNDHYFMNYLAYDESGSYVYIDDNKSYPKIYNVDRNIVIPARKSTKIKLNFSKEFNVSHTEELYENLSSYWDNNTNFDISLFNLPWKSYSDPDFECQVYNGDNLLANDTDYTLDNSTGILTLKGSGSATNTTSLSITYIVPFDSYKGESTSLTDSLKIGVMTSYANIFKDIFTPPVAMAEVQIKTEDTTEGPRDYLVLDASDSFDDNGFIVSYDWSVEGHNISSNSSEFLYNFSGINDLNGRKARTTFDINNYENITINLRVTDDTGMFSYLNQSSGLISI